MLCAKPMNNREKFLVIVMIFQAEKNPEDS